MFHVSHIDILFNITVLPDLPASWRHLYYELFERNDDNSSLVLWLDEPLTATVIWIVIGKTRTGERSTRLGKNTTTSAWKNINVHKHTSISVFIVEGQVEGQVEG